MVGGINGQRHLFMHQTTHTQVVGAAEAIETANATNDFQKPRQAWRRVAKFWLDISQPQLVCVGMSAVDYGSRPIKTPVVRSVWLQ